LAGAIARQASLFFVALQFLTRLPVPRRAVQGFEPGWLHHCVVYFAPVGALVGAIGAVVLWLAGLLWPAGLAALMAVGATVCVTGAFHEDGLADTFDALGGAVSRERALEIMKDSRIGSYGAAALVLTLALRVAALAALAAVDVTVAALSLVAAHTLGRSAAVAVMASLPYAGDTAQAKARPLAAGMSPRTSAMAAGLAAPMLVALAAAMPAGGAARIMVATLAAIATAFVLRRWFLSRLGGYTGDTLGATEQLTEVVVLLTLCAR
jgi:adenosylcobinamide-GDP ribazoletransferase